MADGGQATNAGPQILRTKLSGGTGLGMSGMDSMIQCYLAIHGEGRRWGMTAVGRANESGSFFLF